MLMHDVSFKFFLTVFHSNQDASREFKGFSSSLILLLSCQEWLINCLYLQICNSFPVSSVAA